MEEPIEIPVPTRKSKIITWITYRSKVLANKYPRLAVYLAWVLSLIIVLSIQYIVFSESRKWSTFWEVLVSSFLFWLPRSIWFFFSYVFLLWPIARILENIWIDIDNRSSNRLAIRCFILPIIVVAFFYDLKWELF